MEQEDERQRAHRLAGRSHYVGNIDPAPGVPGKQTAGAALPAGSNGPYRASVFGLQFKAARDDLDSARAHETAERGTSGSGGALPHLSAIQRSFGKHDVSGVRAHVGGAAAEASAALGAHAYASGNSVAFAQAPDLRLAAHEAAHVVQQRGGVRLADGIGRTGDAYEQHADAVADVVVRGDSAEALLDTMAHRGSAGGSAVQRQVRGDRRGSEDDAADVPITAPSEPHALLRYARGVRSHLHDSPGHLVPYARALDTQLRAGAFDARPADVIAVVEALLAIRAELADRRPSELTRFRTAGSPLDGMIEDIAPFGNVDEWHALRAAARTHHEPHRDTHAGTPDGEATTPTEIAPPPPATPPEGPTMGVHGGGTSSRRAGRDIGDSIGTDADHTAGDWGNAIDGAGLAYDTITQFIAVAEVVEIGAMAVQPILATISLVLGMEASWEQTQNGLRVWGMRCALVALDTPFAPYPITLSARELEQHILNSTAAATWQRNVVEATAYEAGGAGEPVQLGRRGVREVAERVNEAVRTAESSPNLAAALRTATPELRARIQQDLRRTMYHRIYEAAAERLAE